MKSHTVGYHLVLLVRDFPWVSKTCCILGHTSTHRSEIIFSKDKKKISQWNHNRRQQQEQEVWPTISIVIVDSTQTPGGCQVFSCDSHIDGVAQVKLDSYAKATLNKHKVSKPVDTHSFTERSRTGQSVTDWLSHTVSEKESHHSGRLAPRLELKGC